MNGLALFAETPRAEEFGHRFLVPADLTVSEFEMAKFFQVAERNISVGENFIAVGRSVSQRSGVGTVRVGREVVILAGIDVPRASGQALSQILTLLQECTGKLEQLVLSEIDWTCMAQPGVIVRRQEMQEWFNDLRSISPPVAEWRDGPRRLQATEASDFQPSELPIRRMPVLVALALGIAAGAFFDHLYFRGSTVTQPDKTTAIEAAASHSVEPTGDPKSAPVHGPINPPSSSVNLAVGIADLLENADRAGKVDALVDILTSLPSKGSISVQDSEALIDFCSRLKELNRFDDCLRVVNQVIGLREAQSLDSTMVARLEDLQMKAREGCESIDQQDRSLYESIRNSTIEQQGKFARLYLEQGPRQSMSRPVKRWIEWTKNTIDVEVIDVDVPTDGPSIIRFNANRRESGFRVKSVDVISSSRPRTIVMAHLGITGRHLPADVRVIVEDLNTGPFLASTRFVGDFQIITNSTDDIRILLQSNYRPRQNGTLTVRLPLIEAAPELPEWKKESP